jgi:hypothetical protein
LAQQLAAAFTSACAFFDAFEMQFSSHVVAPLHP